MAFQLRVLGESGLRGPDQTELQSVLTQPKRLALLTYLAVASPRGWHRRDSLVALLWPEQDGEHARAALRQLLYGLRQSLGEGALLTRGDEVALERSAFECDVWSFEQAAAEGRAETAVELYRGPFLAGFFLSDAPEFEEWVDAERQRLARRYAAMLERVAEEASARDPLSAVTCWRRLAAHDPLSSRVALRLMEAFEAAGEAPAAIRHAEQHAALLRSELDADPDPEVAALAERLRRRSVAVVTPGRASMPVPAPAPAGGAHVAPPAPRRRAPMRAAAAGIPVLALAAVAFWAVRTPSMEPDGDPALREPVLVLPFEMQGGGAEQAPLGVQAAERIAAAIEGGKLGRIVRYRPEDAPRGFSERAGRRAVRATGAGTLVVGTIALRGAELEVQARVVRGSDLATVWTLGPERGPAGDPTPVLDTIRERVLGAVGDYLSPRSGGSLPNPGIYQPPRTLEILRLRAKMDEVFGSGAWLAALPYAQEIFARDTSDMHSVLEMQVIYRNLGRRREADSLLLFLEERRERMYPGNALLLDYFSASRSSPEAAWRAAKALHAADPSKAYLHMTAALRAWRPLEAIRLYESRDTTMLLQREWQQWHFLGVEAYHLLGRFDEELAVARRAKEGTPQTFRHWDREVRALAALGRTDEIETLVTQSHVLETPPGAPLRLTNAAALESSLHGRAQEARTWAERALAGLERWPDSLRAGGDARGIRQNALTILGRYEDVVAMYDEQARRAGPRGLQYRILAAPYRVAAGDTAGALALVDSARSRPLDAFASWQVRGTPLYSAAQILSLLGRRDEAVATLREALNNGARPVTDERLLWYWAPLADYPPFAELVKLRDGG